MSNDDGNAMDASALAELEQTQRELNTISLTDVKKEADRQYRRVLARELLIERRDECKSFDAFMYDCICARCRKPSRCEIAQGRRKMCGKCEALYGTTD